MAPLMAFFTGEAASKVSVGQDLRLGANAEDAVQWEVVGLG